MANLAVGASVLLAGISLILAATGTVAYKRLQHPRLLWVAVAFALFAVEGAYLAWTSYQARADITTWPVLPLLGLAIVAALYLAVLKR